VQEGTGDLVEVLETVAKGGVCPPIVARVMDWVKNRELTGRRHPALEVLTDREVRVLRLLAEGKSTKEIATALNLSAETVRSSRKTLMHKLKIHNLPRLRQFALSAGLIAIAEPRE
jgi:DNA-binding NarL/FixJ family response regulator